DDHVRVDDGELGLQPRMTRHQMAQLGRLMDTALTTLLKPEVLDGVGEVHLVAPDPGGLQWAREDVSGWADKRLPLLVLLVARLLPDEHQPRVGAAAGEHGLGRVLPQLTAAALVDGTFQAPQRGSFRHPRARVLLVGDHRTSPCDVRSLSCPTPSCSASPPAWLPSPYPRGGGSSSMPTTWRVNSARLSSIVRAGAPKRMWPSPVSELIGRTCSSRARVRSCAAATMAGSLRGRSGSSNTSAV